MFDGLQGKLQDVFRQLKGEGKLTEESLDAALRQIRLALLEADVHIRVVRPFVDRVRQRAIGQEVLKSLTPAQHVVKIVRDELAALLGEEGGELALARRPSVVLLCGLQGSGKTTTAGKLARRIAGRGRHPVLVAADLQRAAAVEQLVQVGRGVGVPVITPREGEDVLALAGRAVREAPERGHDVVLFDTAGRLHVDEALMEELRRLAARVDPEEILFVADAMTGQDAVRSTAEFAVALPLTGVVLTKLDGDTRGGAALSIRTVARVPIRFAGVGEKAEDLEIFQPERMASRMIGMGDVLTLIERAERSLDPGERAARPPPGGQRVHPRGPARPAPPGAPPGAPLPAPRDDAPERAVQGAGGRPGGREAAHPGAGDDRLDDPPGAPPPAAPRR
jgi:signal recognition particle subunit SRP54